MWYFVFERVNRIYNKNLSCVEFKRKCLTLTLTSILILILDFKFKRKICKYSGHSYVVDFAIENVDFVSHEIIDNYEISV